MSNYKSVFDYMKSSSDALVHSGVYRKLMSGEGGGRSLRTDLFHRELDLSVTERNLLDGIECPLKFGQRDVLNGGLKLNVGAVARPKQEVGRADMYHNEVVTVDCTRYSPWKLHPKMGRAAYTKKKEALVARDQAIQGKIQSSCPVMGGNEANDLNINLATERMTSQTDMKHIFTKMYLMLCDLTLAATGRSSRYETVSGLRDIFTPNLKGTQRLSAMVEYDIVVDAEGFTNEELELLWLGGEAYPTVWFGGKNVYNSCQLEADSIRIISARDINVQQRWKWDPELMYRTIINLACKLGNIDDWFWVVKNMRGRPQLMSHVTKHTGVKDVYGSVVKSNNANRALGGPPSWEVVPSQYPGYVSSSVGMVADLLLGECLALSSTFCIEEMGGHGTLINPGSGGSKMYKSVMSDFGIGIPNINSNIILRTWSNVTESSFNWGFGRALIDYVERLTFLMRQGIEDTIPQLGFDIAYLSGFDNNWGVSRGVSPLTSSILESMDQEDKRIRGQTSFLWAMGVRKSRPHVGDNANKPGEDYMSSAEYAKLNGSVGRLQMTWTSYTIEGSTGPRKDVTETVATNLFKTAIKGARCTLLMASPTQWAVQQLKKEVEPRGIQETMGITMTKMAGQGAPVNPAGLDDGTQEEIVPVTAGGSKIRDEDDTQVFKKINLGEKESKFRLVVNKSPTPEMRRVEYHNDGGLVRDRIEYKSPRVVDDKEELDVVRLNTPGDGRCGLHAMVAGMCGNGMIRHTETERVMGNMEKLTDGRTFHDVNELGAMALEMGVGLRVIADGGENVNVYEYGNDRFIDIYHKGDHYEGAFVNTGEGERRKVGIVTNVALPEGSYEEQKSFIRSNAIY